MPCQDAISAMPAGAVSGPEIVLDLQCYESLLEYMDRMPESRRRCGIRHRIAVVLAFAVAAVMAQADSVTAIAEWAGDVPLEALQALGQDVTGADGSSRRRCPGRRVRRLADRAGRRRPGRVLAGDRAGRQDRPRRETQGRQGPAPARRDDHRRPRRDRAEGHRRQDQRDHPGQAPAR